MENTHVNESILSAEILEDQKKNRIDHMKYLKGMEDIGSEVLNKVVSEMEAYDYDKYNETDVRRALAHSERTPEDFGHFYHRQLCRFLRRLPRQPRWRRESISETASICSLRSTLQTTVKIIVFIVGSTVTIRSTVHS